VAKFTLVYRGGNGCSMAFVGVDEGKVQVGGARLVDGAEKQGSD
jgi:hypothetical protein